MSPTRPKSADKKQRLAEHRVAKILSKIEALKLSAGYVSKLSVRGSEGVFWERIRSKMKWVWVVLVVGAAVWMYYFYSSSDCLLRMPFDKALFRAPEDCSMCRGVRLLRLENVSRERFERELAYSTTPVVVTDAVRRWRAAEEFSFDFFRDFYQRGDLGRRTGDCSFFSYKSGLASLHDVFQMEPARANLTPGTEPWYVGWNTCYELESRRLRQYYSRPYFLPASAESEPVDWIFMGGPGQGAHMHVDSVKHMSWQAQVRGSKEWVLAPPPECLYACDWITFAVSPGEMLVVDTNRWYHKTRVLPGEVSITIGAEYD